MHLRKLVILLGVLSLLVSRSVLALGLGDISLNSSLNQPLDAHIGLRDLGDLSAEQIVIKLGSEEDFEKVGLERSFFYTQLRFNVVTDGPNGPFVAVTSRDPVREPYLSFVVDMRWTSGRVMREYTLLLDLPTFSGETAAPVQGSVTPIASSSQPAKSEPVRQRTDSGAVSADNAGGDVYGPVKASDTLWEIARDYRPGSASIHQTMLAIQQANPDAFIRNNINLLRKGQVLRIPSETEIRNLNNRQAVNRVAEQNREWSGDAMGAQLDGSGRTNADRSAPSEVSGRVRLASGSNEAADTSNAGAGSAGTEELSRELTDAKDELARTRGENSELRSRVGDLEEQIETMERLLAVSNEQMRALELAAQQEEGADDSAASVADAKPAGTDNAEPAKNPMAGVEPGSVEQDVKPETAAKPDAETPATKPDATAAKPEVEKPVRNTSKVVRRAPEPTLMDKLMNNLLWIVLALVVIVLLVVVALRKRGSKAGEDEDFTSDYDEPIAYEDAESEAEFEQTDAELEQELADEQLLSESDDAETSIEAETGDVVGEADIYIALGKYDQAEEMLLAGLEREPGSMAINLKLLELYGESNNLEAFDARLANVFEQGDEDSIARAKSLREQHFAGAAEFVTPAVVAGAAVATSTDDLGEDDFAQTFDLNDESEIADNQELDLDDNFDFDLSDELSEGASDESLGSTDYEAPTASDELELDESSSSYDLSFDSDTEEDALEFDLDLDLDDDNDAGEADDSLSLDLDHETDKPDAADDLELSLDDLEPMAPEDVAPPQQLDSDELADLEFDLDAISDDSGQADSEGGVSLTDEKPLLDEDFSFDTPLDLEPEEDEAPVYGEPEPYSPSADGEPRVSVALDGEASPDLEADVPTLDLAEDDADDFDLDKAMDDFDLESMDADMADLDDADDAEDGESFDVGGAEQAPEAFDADEDEAFAQALGGLGDDESAPEDVQNTDDLSELDDDGDLDDEDLDFLTDSDEVTTKLDLARAYIDMGDLDGARDILAEVAEEGNDEQKAEANSLLEKAQS
ncbi:FimV/HubP family polar landmark protein [Gilvimarinus agarilyticus]|uniref:FimV/HubP family polar landmark protein n=1 Tax=Gilvimarinus agarilyticus TaxID=679259 RepID=UPI0005A22BB7|nr:FimV/HubP family polar landmark protein [Gilvimarinus agarilyticus]